MANRQYSNNSQPNDTYNSIREQLLRETSNLMQERNSIQVHRPSNTYVPPNRNIDSSPKSKWQPQVSQKRSSYQVDGGKKNQIKNRIRELIDLCKEENYAVTKEVHGVIEAQKGVLQLLNQTEHDQFNSGPDSVAPANGHYTPIKGPGTEQFRDTQANPSKNLQNQIRSIIQQNSHIRLSQDANQLIDQIERRALLQIQKLREEKLGLINSLNQQIRNTNAEKKRNMELEKELSYYRKNQGQRNAPDGTSEGELRSRIAQLQNYIQQQQKSGFSLPDFNTLYEQGEAIRQQTLRLIRLKQAKGGRSDDEQKRRLREEVSILQQRIDQLQQERGERGVRVVSKPSYEVINEEYSPIAPAHKRANSYRNSANQYESLVMEMRKITAN